LIHAPPHSRSAPAVASTGARGRRGVRGRAGAAIATGRVNSSLSRVEEIEGSQESVDPGMDVETAAAMALSEMFSQ